MEVGPARSLLQLILGTFRWLMARKLISFGMLALLVGPLLALEFHLGLVAEGLLPILLGIILYKLATRGPLKAQRDQDARKAMLVSRFILVLFPVGGAIAAIFVALGLLFATSQYLDSRSQPPGHPGERGPSTYQL